MIADGRLEIKAGRITDARETADGLEIDYVRRGGSQLRTETFAYAFNSTGPLHSITRSKNPVLRSLLDASAVQPDHLGIGLSVGEDCRAGPRLWAMGPLTKGRYWEITAVPDIREQAVAVAEDITRELGK
jgi:uncharacterized NAD(P)/FAD-binding protein YdhS